MGGHMLKYHVALPLAVFGGLLLFGVPFAGAVRFGIAAGCVAMMLMMLRGNSHDHDNGRKRDDGDLDREAAVVAQAGVEDGQETEPMKRIRK